MIRKSAFMFFIFILGIALFTYGEEKEESPFEYNSRWYKNDFKWWDTWHKELYKNLGEKKSKDIYNVGHVIDSINRLKKWVFPEKGDLFKDYLEFYEMVKETVGKGNLRRYEIRSLQSLLKEKRKEFIAKFHYKNIEVWEWINEEIVDTSALEKVEIVPFLPTSKKGSGYRYVAHGHGRVFHKLSCEGARNIKESDVVYFKTKRRALSTGRKPCYNCKP